MKTKIRTIFYYYYDSSNDTLPSPHKKKSGGAHLLCTYNNYDSPFPPFIASTVLQVSQVWAATILNDIGEQLQ